MAKGRVIAEAVCLLLPIAGAGDDTALYFDGDLDTETGLSVSGNVIDPPPSLAATGKIVVTISEFEEKPEEDDAEKGSDS